MPFSHQEKLKKARIGNKPTIINSTQNKTLSNTAEYTDNIIGPAIINFFVIFVRIFSKLKLPYLFFVDLGVKGALHPVKIIQLWRSDKPLFAKIFGTTVRVTAYTLISSAVSTAVKPIATALAKLTSAAIAGSAGPFLFTITFSIFTGLSALDLKNKVQDLKNHPWKVTEIEKLKRTNKTVKTVGLAIGTAGIWPMFKFGLVPVIVGAKVVALASNPIGWAIAAGIGVTLAGMGVYKLYARRKLQKLHRQTARTMVDNAVNPEVTLEIDLDSIKKATEKRLTLAFEAKNADLGKISEQQYQEKLQNYLYKGSRFDRFKALFGGGNPLGRAYSKDAQEEINKQYDIKTDKILGFVKETLQVKLNSIVDYKYTIFGKVKLTKEEKLKIAREDYLKYGACRYEIELPKHDNRWPSHSQIIKQLESKKVAFNESDKAKQLNTLQKHAELLSNDYGRDFYQNTKLIHTLARDKNFNPYDALGVALNANPKEIKRAYETKMKSLDLSQDIKDQSKQAYQCLSDKQQKECFDVTFAAFHNKDLYKIVTRNDNSGPINDSHTLEAHYKKTKNALNLVSSAENTTNLQELEWAYHLLKNTDNRARYEQQREVKAAYDNKVNKMEESLKSKKEEDVDLSSTYSSLIVKHLPAQPTISSSEEVKNLHYQKTLLTYNNVGKRNASGITDAKRIAGRLVREEAREILLSSLEIKNTL